MPILSLSHVTKDYLSDGQPVRALDDVSLVVQRGMFVALVGQSGCGKTTLLNVSGAMNYPTSAAPRRDTLLRSSRSGEKFVTTDRTATRSMRTRSQRLISSPSAERNAKTKPTTHVADGENSDQLAPFPILLDSPVQFHLRDWRVWRGNSAILRVGGSI